jgi:hypothetical protein
MEERKCWKFIGGRVTLILILKKELGTLAYPGGGGGGSNPLPRNSEFLKKLGQIPRSVEYKSNILIRKRVSLMYKLSETPY